MDRLFPAPAGRKKDECFTSSARYTQVFTRLLIIFSPEEVLGDADERSLE
jgi:hypothetical protein